MMIAIVTFSLSPESKYFILMDRECSPKLPDDRVRIDYVLVCNSLPLFGEILLHGANPEGKVECKLNQVDGSSAACTGTKAPH